ncbi:MAG: hypothetical protein ABSA75_10385 [Candidatus Bathyarchaeia archaeon]|jgi:hypothetical protein
MQSEDIVQEFIEFVASTGRLPNLNEPGLEQLIQAAIKTFGSLENALKVAGLLTNNIQSTPISIKSKRVAMQTSESKHSFSSYPQDYFLELLDLKRTQRSGSPSPDGTPNWWERRANAQYDCSSCQKVIKKGDRYIGRKKLHPGQRGVYGYKGTYSTDYFHIACLLGIAKTEIESTIQKLDFEIGKNQKEIGDYQGELSLRGAQAENCRSIIEQAKSDYKQASSLSKKIGKWFGTTYTSWSRNREIQQLQRRIFQVENIEIPKRQKQITGISEKKLGFQHKLSEIVSRLLESDE